MKIDDTYKFKNNKIKLKDTDNVIWEGKIDAYDYDYDENEQYLIIEVEKIIPYRKLKGKYYEFKEDEIKSIEEVKE